MTLNSSSVRVCAVAVALASLIDRTGYGRAASAAPKLAAPTGTIVKVSNEQELQAAVGNLSSDTTILVAAGTYRLTRTLWINGAFRNVSIRGASGTADDVVLLGPGMARASVGDVPYGIFVGGGAADVEIANLTIRDIYYRAVVLMPGTLRPHIYNVHFIDSGEQFIDGRTDDDGGNGVVGALVEYSKFEYSTTARTASTPAVSVHGGTDWIFRHDEFRNIVGPSWQMAGPAILAWGGSSGTIVDSNSFFNASLGVAFGLQESQGVDHRGGIIRNNMIFRSAAQSGGAGVQLANAAAAQVLNNTVFLSGTYGTPIEYRFEQSHDVVIANNLSDGVVWARDGATGIEAGNVTNASADMFVDAPNGDLHLSARATTAIDRGVNVDVAYDWDGRARPAGRAYDVGAHEFAATLATQAARVGISGRITDASGAALANVTIRLTGTETHTGPTNGNGAYNFPNVAPGGTYTVTPSLSGFAFSPASLTFNNLTATQSSADFVAANATVTMTSPLANSTAVAPATITFAATVVTSAVVSRVSFFSGPTSVASDTAPPYTATWSGVPAGTYSLEAVAYLSDGTSVHSEQTTVTVVASSSTPAPSTGVATLTANPTSVTAGGSSVLTLTTPTADYHNITINGTRVTNISCAATCTGTLVVTPTQTTTYQAAANNNAGAPYTMPSGTVTVVAEAPSAPSTGSATLTADLTSIAAGQSSTLTLTTPNTNYHNVFVSGIRPSLNVCSTTCTYTLTVNPFTTTTYYSAATDSTGVPYSMPSLTVTVTGSTGPAPAPAAPLTPLPTPSGDPSTWPLVSGNSGLQYVGAFRLPRGNFGASYLYNSFDGAPDNALTFNPSGNNGNGSLFIAAAFNANNDGSIPVAEISIPAPVGGSDVTAMPTAAVLQNLADPTEGRWQQITGSGYKANRLGGLLVDNGKLLISEYVYYDANGEQSMSHIVRNSLNLSAAGQASGPFGAAKTFFSAALGNAGYVAGHMTPIPPSWQSRLGGTAITGLSMAPIISRTSYGPGAFSFTPGNMGSNYVANPLLYYPQTHTTLGPGDVNTPSPYFALTDFSHGIAFPDGTRSLLFFGMHGTGKWCYGVGVNDPSMAFQPNPSAGPNEVYCYDPANGAKGQHAYPYVPYVWAYDANDLAAVRAGTKQPWDVLPQVWTLSTPFPASYADLGGVAYDPATRRIFVALRGGDQMQPLILTYQIQ